MHPFSLYEHGDDIQWIGRNSDLRIHGIERTSIRNCPMLMVAGNAAGLGKGELCRGVIYLAYGVKGDLITVGEDKTERDKRIDAVLIDGAPAFTIDNMNDQVFDSVTLASIATEGVANIRPFGRNSGQIRVEGLSLVMINGNKLFVVGDNVRRTFRIELNTRNPFPATRPFPFTPEEEVRRTRIEMLEAAFTIMRWWRQRGMKGDAPGNGRQLGSFEMWSQRVADLVHELTWRRAKAAEGGKRKAREGKVMGEVDDEDEVREWLQPSDGDRAEFQRRPVPPQQRGRVGTGDRTVRSRM